MCFLFIVTVVLFSQECCLFFVHYFYYLFLSPTFFKTILSASHKSNFCLLENTCFILKNSITEHEDVSVSLFLVISQPLVTLSFLIYNQSLFSGCTQGIFLAFSRLTMYDIYVEWFFIFIILGFVEILGSTR